MPLAFRETSATKMQTKRSAWTPLNHPLINNHVFEERRTLLGKWFDKWTDSQRKQVLQDLFSQCTAGQLKYLRQSLCSQVPDEALDFTSVLPRVISLYIFSYLDPRSLCRCAQVTWHWKSLVELDQLWMPKCLRLGWCITFTPTPFEQCVWKRHYVETVQGLHISRPKTPAKEEFVVPEVRVISSEMDESTAEIGCRNQGPSQRGRSLSGRGSLTKGLPPWRDSDRHPTDTIRFNYLENLDPVEHARQAQARSSRANPNATTQENTKKKALSGSSYRLRKAKSLMFLSLERVADGKKRPQWAKQSSSALSANKDPEKRLGSSQWNAGIRPGPVRPPIPKLSEKGLKVSQRSHRSTPTVPLLEAQPWRSPASEDN